jgi:hypothetical protein
MAISVMRTLYRSVTRRLPKSIATPIRRGVGQIVSLFGPRPTVSENEARLQARLRLANGYYKDVSGRVLEWARSSREDSNFSFDITDRSKDYLAATISVVTGASIEQIQQYFTEPAADLAGYMPPLAAPLAIDHPLNFGRRLGWYAIARAMKPRVIVETGVMHGIGAALLCSALRRNAREGAPGRYYGTEIDLAGGVLLAPPLTAFGEILFGDSIESLRKLDAKIDLFINDSDHSEEYEEREYQCVRPMLSERAIVLGDNSHVTDKLLRFSIETGRQFLFFRETPKDHWYPGSGIGISFTRSALQK